MDAKPAIPVVRTRGVRDALRASVGAHFRFGVGFDDSIATIGARFVEALGGVAGAYAEHSLRRTIRRDDVEAAAGFFARNPAKLLEVVDAGGKALDEAARRALDAYLARWGGGTSPLDPAPEDGEDEEERAVGELNG